MFTHPCLGLTGTRACWAHIQTWCISCITYGRQVVLIKVTLSLLSKLLDDGDINESFLLFKYLHSILHSLSLSTWNIPHSLIISDSSLRARGQGNEQNTQENKRELCLCDKMLYFFVPSLRSLFGMLLTCLARPTFPVCKINNNEIVKIELKWKIKI